MGKGESGVFPVEGRNLLWVEENADSSLLKGKMICYNICDKSRQRNGRYDTLTQGDPGSAAQTVAVVSAWIAGTGSEKAE